MKITLQMALDAMDNRACQVCRQPNGTAALSELGKMRFTARINWQIGRIIPVIEKAVSEYQLAEREKIMSYGNQVAPDQYRVPIEQEKEYQREMTELRAQEIDIYGKPIRLSELGAKADEISGEVFSNCAWLFEADEATGEEGSTGIAEKAEGTASA